MCRVGGRERSGSRHVALVITRATGSRAVWSGGSGRHHCCNRGCRLAAPAAAGAAVRRSRPTAAHVGQPRLQRRGRWFTAWKIWRRGRLSRSKVARVGSSPTASRVRPGGRPGSSTASRIEAVVRFATWRHQQPVPGQPIGHHRRRQRPLGHQQAADFRRRQAQVNCFRVTRAHIDQVRAGMRGSTPLGTTASVASRPRNDRKHQWLTSGPDLPAPAPDNRRTSSLASALAVRSVRAVAGAQGWSVRKAFCIRYCRHSARTVFRPGSSPAWPTLVTSRDRPHRRVHGSQHLGHDQRLGTDQVHQLLPTGGAEEVPGDTRWCSSLGGRGTLAEDREFSADASAGVGPVGGQLKVLQRPASPWRRGFAGPETDVRGSACGLQQEMGLKRSARAATALLRSSHQATKPTTGTAGRRSGGSVARLAAGEGKRADDPAARWGMSAVSANAWGKPECHRGRRARRRRFSGGRTAPLRCVSSRCGLPRFCTCSRICSTSTFISTEMVVSSSAADLLPSVLASRCSSWIRKSGRLPSSPPAVSSRSISSRCEARRVRFLGHVDADGIGGGFVQRTFARSCDGTEAARGGGNGASFQRSRKRCCWRCCWHQRRGAVGQFARA